MSRGFPSMTALLGLLALAGYQNRDKLAELLKGAGNTQPGASNEKGPLDEVLGNLSGGLAGTGIGGTPERRSPRTTRSLQAERSGRCRGVVDK